MNLYFYMALGNDNTSPPSKDYSGFNVSHGRIKLWILTFTLILPGNSIIAIYPGPSIDLSQTCSASGASSSDLQIRGQNVGGCSTSHLEMVAEAGNHFVSA